MKMKQQINSDELEKKVAEDIWLNYFNRYLFENGTISEREYRSMTEKIAKKRALKMRGKVLEK